MAARPRVVLVGPTHPFRGGLSYHTTFLFRHLRARLPQAEFYSWWRQYPRLLFPGRSDRDPAGAPPLEPGTEAPLDGCNPLSFLALGLRLRRRRPDLLILPWWVAFWAPHMWLLLASARARRVLFVVHNAAEHEAAGWKRWATRLLLRRADVLLAHASSDAAALRELLPGARVIEGYHPSYAELGGGGPDAAPAPASARAALDREHRLDPGQPLLLFFGFVRPYKGLPDLIEALPLMTRPAQLLVAGEFWSDSRAELEQQLARLQLSQRVRVVDRYLPTEAIAPLLAGADAVALPYRSGTGSGILQTAFGLGRPVVATRVGSLADAVRDGVTGELAPPQDPPALAAALDRCLERGPAFYAEAIARDQAERFSWSGLVELLLEGALES